MAVNLNLQLFDQYVAVSRLMMAELSKIVGDSYDPGADYNTTNTIHRVVAISQTVLTMTQSLHAFHPPMVSMGDSNITPAGLVNPDIRPAPAPPATPLQTEPPPASV